MKDKIIICEIDKHLDYLRTKSELIGLIIRIMMVCLGIWILFFLTFGFSVVKGQGMYPKVSDDDLIFLYRSENKYTIGDVLLIEKGGRKEVGSIVAMQGDVVEFSDDGLLLINGNPQQEEIFFASTIDGRDTTYPYKVKENDVFIDSSFSLVVKGNNKDVEYTFTLEALDADSPMPELSTGNKKTISESKSGTYSFGKITFGKIGEYSYKITQAKGTEKDTTYDTSEYLLTVYVSWKDVVGGEKSIVTVFSDFDTGEKTDAIKFTNTVTGEISSSSTSVPEPSSSSYTEPTPPTDNPQTGDTTPVNSLKLALALSGMCILAMLSLYLKKASNT